MEGNTERDHGRETLELVTLVRNDGGRKSPQTLESLLYNAHRGNQTKHLLSTIIPKPSAMYTAAPLQLAVDECLVGDGP